MTQDQRDDETGRFFQELESEIAAIKRAMEAPPAHPGRPTARLDAPTVKAGRAAPKPESLQQRLSTLSSLNTLRS